MDSYDYYSLKNKGINFVNRGLYKEAIEWFDQVLKIKPDDCNSLRYKGISLVWLERYKEAIECYDRALKIKSDDYDSLRNKGISLFRLKRYNEAIECYDRALKFKPDDYDSLREKGVSLLWLKRYKEAVECYDRALKFKSDDYNSLRHKGVTLGFLGMYKEAIESLDQVLKIKPDDYQSLKNKDNILEKMRNDRNIKIKTQCVDKSTQDNFKYDVALSFAGEDRKIVEQIAKKLAENNIQVFYDEFEKTKLWGKRLSPYLQKTYGENTCFVLVFVSKEYSLKEWTNFEFSIARVEAKVRGHEFILPVRLDNTPLFGLPDDMAYLDLNTEGIEGIVRAVIDKLRD